MRGRPKAFWTPGYVWRRSRDLLYVRRHPDEPWLTPTAIRLIDSWLRPTDHGVEFGAGRSTRWLASRVANVISVEHDESWFRTVEADLRDCANAEVRLAPRSVDAYLATVSDVDEVDFVLNDGKYRGAVTEWAVERLRPGGLLIVDDSHRYLPDSPCATDAGDPSAQAVAGWRVLWTTNGNRDTALLVKPA